MSFRSVSWILCLQLVCLASTKAFQFTIDRQPDGQFCGKLHCSANYNTTDPAVFSISGLSILERTSVNTTSKLVSASIFSPGLELGQDHINQFEAVGAASRYNASLTLHLKSHADCLQTSFVCELDFFNTRGESESTTQTVDSAEGNELPLILNLLDRLSGQIKNLTDGSYQRQTALETQIATLKQQNSQLDNKLDNILGQLARLEAIVNATSNNDVIYPINCAKGMTHDQDRVKVKLWNRQEVLCDTKTDGGGWIVIQRRTKGDVDFYRDWNSYKNGFGTPDTDYWIGNDVIHTLTTQGYNELRIDLNLALNRPNVYLQAGEFHVGDEASNYQLSLAPANGTVEDFMSFHNQMRFSTYDRDNDQISDSCAKSYHGGWWYNNCFHSNLNGLWRTYNYSGMNVELGNEFVFPTFSEMKIRNS